MFQPTRSVVAISICVVVVDLALPLAGTLQLIPLIAATVTTLKVEGIQAVHLKFILCDQSCTLLREDTQIDS